MIEEQATLCIQPPAPAVLLGGRAYLGCGCSIWVGWRVDNGEVATVSQPCGEEHDQLIRHATLMLRESTVNPTGRKLLDVCESFLEDAAEYYGAA